MKSNIISKISLGLFALMATVPLMGMSDYYQEDPKVVTTEEKINHYLFYLTNHGLAAVTQHGIEKAIPQLVERAAVDGARIFLPDVLGIKTPAQKRLLDLGIIGAREAVRFSARSKQIAQQRGVKIKRTDLMKNYLTKQFIPVVVKSLVVDLFYYGSSHFANSLLQKVGLNPATLASSPYSVLGMFYQQARNSGHGICEMAYDMFLGGGLAQARV
jgi:hypothetical protein